MQLKLNNRYLKSVFFETVRMKTEKVFNPSRIVISHTDTRFYTFLKKFSVFENLK